VQLFAFQLYLQSIPSYNRIRRDAYQQEEIFLKDCRNVSPEKFVSDPIAHKAAAPQMDGEGVWKKWTMPQKNYMPQNKSREMYREV
jgi:hypothetical protein